MNVPERKTGVIKLWRDPGGWGFILTDDHREVFFHISAWNEDDDPRKGETVSFIEEAGRDERPRAKQVTRSNARFKPRPF